MQERDQRCSIDYVDCTDVGAVRLPKSACLSILTSASEVYPRECIGGLYGSNAPRSVAYIESAVPYQLAKRGKSLAEQEKSSFKRIQSLFADSEWLILGGYHSHPSYDSRYVFSAEPSKIDIEGLEVGEMEMIVRVSKKKKRTKGWCRNTSAGNISASWGEYLFLIKAFIRVDKPSRCGYKRVPILLVD